MLKEAEIDSTRRYRYWLRRLWDPKLTRMVWVMLNPSTADASLDDPTIKRCISFAQAWGFGGIDVVNLFAYRATDPNELMKTPDPVGSENDARIIEASTQRDIGLIVIAWGAKGGLLGRNQQVLQLLKEHAWHDTAVMCLGLTAEGHPKHPLYVPADKQLEICS